MDTTQRELDTIELQLDTLRVARFKRFNTSMLGAVLGFGTITSGSVEGSTLALCFYFSMAVATVSSQISMSELKERRETLSRILLAERKRTKKTNAQ
ncbi:hypothetical protein KA050_03140 [Candidatus Gracilibacteria bacterium]|nr:hypothetical protein [Candidatus Gracilibacteria bacterium]